VAPAVVKAALAVGVAGSAAVATRAAAGDSAPAR
jgi:hypothetical protein